MPGASIRNLDPAISASTVNLVLLTGSLGSGGAERQLVTLAIELKELGHEIQFLGYTLGDFYLEEL